MQAPYTASISFVFGLYFDLFHFVLVFNDRNKYDMNMNDMRGITMFTWLIEHIRAWEWVSALTFMVTLSLQIILYSIVETL